MGLSVTTAACASSPTPPPQPATPPSAAFDQASGKGATNAQPPSDDVMFVEQEHKEPATHQDDAPVTPLQANPQTARPKH